MTRRNGRFSLLFQRFAIGPSYIVRAMSKFSRIGLAGVVGAALHAILANHLAPAVQQRLPIGRVSLTFFLALLSALAAGAVLARLAPRARVAALAVAALAFLLLAAATTWLQQCTPAQLAAINAATPLGCNLGLYNRARAHLPPDGRPAELAPGVWFDRHGLSYACLPPEAQATHLRVALADYALALVGMSLGALLGARQRRRRDQD